MKKELKELAQRLEAIIETAIDGIITIDKYGNIESVNSAVLNMFGFSREEMLGNNIKMLMPQPYKREHDDYLENYTKTRHPKIIGIGREVEGCKKSGEVFPIRLAVSEVKLNDRVIYTGIVHDLSEIKGIEEELRESNERLEEKVEERTNELESVVNKLLFTNKQLERSQGKLKEALEKERILNELKSRFVSMASHEFRTPLSTVMSSASIISKYTDEQSNDKREKHVERIKSAVSNLTGILNDFLSLSKLEENKVDLVLKDMNFVELIDTVADEIRGLLKDGQQIVQMTTGDSRPVKTDIRILKNVLFNLVSNAIKYSPENTTIRCHATYLKEALIIEIIDEGIGIPENEQKYMFERFFRASNVENIQGTGLGLNIVKRYLDLLNGNITFTSTPGKGSNFRVRIPIQ
ncbi:MAG: PAS domain-containing sensor histidine kinase [Saprospiraceae bacterium]|nr:PAS domain-containing sensor histidine kinase [Saprospiraceae bacterium]